MCQYRLDQHLIVLNLYIILVNKILVTAFVKVSQNLSLMQKMPAQWIHQVRRHTFSKVIECLEKSSTQNRKQVDYKNLWNTKSNWIEYKILELKYWIQNCRIFEWVTLVLKDFASTGNCGFGHIYWRNP